ncbi:MAG: hypothetical protein AB1345_06015 [Chloroflexota bacterium]
MSHQVESVIIIATWVVLFVFLPVSRYFVKRRFLEGSPNVILSNKFGQDNKPGSLQSKVGTSFVFAANLATFALVFTAAVSPSAVQRLDWISVDLPSWVNFLGSILFVLNAVWGLLALSFNPNYTPLFQAMKDRFLPATCGPYAMVRHPRYVGESAGGCECTNR